MAYQALLERGIIVKSQLAERDVKEALAAVLSEPVDLTGSALKAVTDLVLAILDGSNTENSEAVLAVARRVSRDDLGREGPYHRKFPEDQSGWVEL